MFAWGCAKKDTALLINSLWFLHWNQCYRKRNNSKDIKYVRVLKKEYRTERYRGVKIWKYTECARLLKVVYKEKKFTEEEEKICKPDRSLENVLIFTGNVLGKFHLSISIKAASLNVPYLLDFSFCHANFLNTSVCGNIATQKRMTYRNETYVFHAFALQLNTFNISVL